MKYVVDQVSFCQWLECTEHNIIFFFLSSEHAVSEFLDFRVLSWENCIVFLCSPEMFVFESEGGQIVVSYQLETQV